MVQDKINDPDFNNETGCNCGDISKESSLKIYRPIISSLTLYTIGVLLDFIVKPPFFTGNIRLFWYIYGKSLT